MIGSVQLGKGALCRCIALGVVAGEDARVKRPVPARVGIAPVAARLVNPTKLVGGGQKGRGGAGISVAVIEGGS